MSMQNSYQRHVLTSAFDNTTHKNTANRWINSLLHFFIIFWLLPKFTHNLRKSFKFFSKFFIHWSLHELGMIVITNFKNKRRKYSFSNHKIKMIRFRCLYKLFYGFFLVKTNYPHDFQNKLNELVCVHCHEWMDKAEIARMPSWAFSLFKFELGDTWFSVERNVCWIWTFFKF